MTDRRNPSREDLYREATRAMLLGLFLNLALGVAKLLGGVLGQSFALISDAVNSLGDVFTSLVVLFALRIAQQPADERHPYGRARAEAIAGSNVSLLVILSALWVGWAALRRLNVQHELPASWTLWIAGLNVVIKESLYHYKVRVGRRTGSTAILANAWDHRSDALCALAVLIGLGAVRLGGPAFIMADEIASLIIVGFILRSAVALFRRSAQELMDVQAEDELVLAVRKAASEVPGVYGVEKLWMRKSGLEFLVDIHIEVDPQLSVAEGHRIGHQVKDHLLEQFGKLRDVLVHLEPHSPAMPSS
jgi:cation diffusion facilitator family transporter